MCVCVFVCQLLVFSLHRFSAVKRDGRLDVTQSMAEETGQLGVKGTSMLCHIPWVSLDQLPDFAI